MEKFDKVIYGIIGGTILPVFGFLISYYVKTRGTAIDFDMYTSMAFNQSQDQQDILIFCLIPNMLLFYFTNFRWNLYEVTKGLVGATLVLGIILFLLVM